MSTLPARNRVIYQSEALFVSPDTTGHHLFYDPKFTGSTDPATPGDCWVSGVGAEGGDIFLNICDGSYSPAGKHITLDAAKADTDLLNAKYITLNNNGTGASEWHPILERIGIDTTNPGFNGPVDGLEHLKILDDPIKGSWGTTVSQLKRVQNANYSFTINRQDVNQFGQLGRIDSVVLEAPTVSLDFSYYLTDGENERLLGFNTNAAVQSLSGIMTRSQNDFGNNFFILTVPEGRDAVGGDVSTSNSDQTVIGLGNGYITDYSLEASVGSFPTCSVTVEGLNIKSDIGTSFKSIPAVDPENGTNICDREFFLPPSISGQGASILKPGDITIDLSNSSLISKQISGSDVSYGDTDEGSAHIQSFSLSTPMGRTDLQRIGNTYSYAKELDFPITCTLTVNALVADLKEGNLVNLLCGQEYDINIKMQHPQCIECDPNSTENAISINFRGALLDSESFSSAIGDNKSVDLTFSTQIGGPEQDGVGVFFSGFENSQGADNKWKYPPNIKEGKYHPYGNVGTTGGFADGRY